MSPSVVVKHLSYSESTQEGDEWTCDGAPEWVPLPKDDCGKTPGQLSERYAKLGLRGFRARRVKDVGGTSA